MLQFVTPDITRERARDLSPTHLLQRICVRPPYFALRGLRIVEGGIEATLIRGPKDAREERDQFALRVGRHVEDDQPQRGELRDQFR